MMALVFLLILAIVATFAGAQNTAVTGTYHPLTATATLDFANIIAIGCNDLTISVPGAALGDMVILGVPHASIPTANYKFFAWVSSANTVTVRGCALVSGDAASGSFTVGVIKP
jgi:hypothetical protein